jgi:acyl dehydratase
VEERTFESVEIGDELPESKPDVSMPQVRAFCGASGNSAGRFTDHDAARKQGLPSAIVPGIMSQALLASVIHRWAAGSVITKIDTVFRAQIPVDSQPVCRAVVTDLDAEAREIEVDLTILNEAGETRVLGTARVRLASG